MKQDVEETGQHKLVFACDSSCELLIHFAHRLIIGQQKRQF